MYVVTIELLDGQVTRATVSKATLRGLRMKLCRSVKWERVS